MRKVIALFIVFVFCTIAQAAQHVHVYDTEKGLLGSSIKVNIYPYLEKVLKDFPKERIVFWSVDGLERNNNKFPTKITILTEDIK